ncbi:MAG: hypothetical protein NG740_03555 [Omnitrophica bacterium]|nr:hypothetical protein [Candidatus Omnitrophota bacterium]
MQNDENFISTIWIDNLSIVSLPAIFKIARRKKGATLCFLKASYIAHTAIKCITRLNITHLKVENITQSLADMWVGNQSMAMKKRFKLPEMAHRVFQEVKKQQGYKVLCRTLPEKKVGAFFERIIHEELCPLIRVLLRAQWHKTEKNGNTACTIMLCPNSELMPAIKQIWPDKDILLVPYRHMNVRHIKRLMKRLLHGQTLLVGGNDARLRRKSEPANFITSRPKIAVHYSQGIDLKKRSIISWYPDSKIEAGQVLIYFDNKSAHKRIPEEICKKIEKMGMGWCAFEKKIMDNAGKYAWKNIKCSDKDNMDIAISKVKKNTRCNLDKWILGTAKDLVAHIRRWITFSEFFGVKIINKIGVQDIESIAQSISLDFTGGIRLGIQRSTLPVTRRWTTLIYGANDRVFFWGSDALMHIETGTDTMIKKLIIAGYPFDWIFYRGPLRNNVRNRLKDSNVTFVIALFDNVFSEDIYISRNMMETFYRKFLEWLIEDNTLAIITKEKKTALYNRLTGIHGLVAAAQKTGRYIRLKDAYNNRFPSDASYGADIAVGISVSTALTEAVIAGTRGVHCDLPGHYFHPFYKWGYEKIVFNDIDRLIDALKIYKENPSKKPELGDWSSYIDRLDPFRDGKSGERMGSYMRWLLENFDKGKNRDEAMEYADRQYAREWGEDKIINVGAKP